MSQRSLEEFGAYQKALELFHHVVADMKLVQREPLCYRSLADEIIGILTATIERLRAQPTPSSTGMMREEATDYGQ